MPKRRPYNPQFARPLPTRFDRLEDAVARDNAKYRRPETQAAAPAGGAEPKTETKTGGE